MHIPVNRYLPEKIMESIGSAIFRGKLDIGNPASRVFRENHQRTQEGAIMGKAELLELAERVEKLEGQDDEVDLAIAVWCYENGGIAGVNYDPKLWIERNGGEFTASMDAALSLVPEAFRFILDKRPAAAVRSDGYRAVVWHAPIVLYEKMGVWARTPALALTAAALRARATTLPGEEG